MSVNVSTTADEMAVIGSSEVPAAATDDAPEQSVVLITMKSPSVLPLKVRGVTILHKHKQTVRQSLIDGYSVTYPATAVTGVKVGFAMIVRSLPVT